MICLRNNFVFLPSNDFETMDKENSQSAVSV